MFPRLTFSFLNTLQQTVMSELILVKSQDFQHRWWKQGGKGRGAVALTKIDVCGSIAPTLSATKLQTDVLLISPVA